MDLDSVIKELGEFSKYQIYIFSVLATSIIFNAFYSISYVFTAGDLNYRCYIESCDNKSNPVFEQDWLIDALPYKNGQMSKCERFAFKNATSQNCHFFDKGKTERCNEFVFQTQETSIANEFNLLCDENRSKLALVGTINNVGQFFGLPLAGMLSDRFGRKLVLSGMVLLSSIMGILRSFSPTYNIFLLFELLDAMVAGGCYSAAFILGMEFIGPNKRVFGSMLICSCYSAGEVIMGLVVWAIPNWRIYLRILYFPGFLFAICIWTVPESIRWLYTQKKYQEMRNVLDKIASANGKKISNHQQQKLNLLELENKKDDTIQEKFDWTRVFKSNVIRNRLIVCSFVWMTHTFVFYGLSLNSVSVAGNKYFNFILVSLAEIPGHLSTLPVMDRYGRRISNSSFLYISGLSCLGFYFLPQDMINMRLILFLIGKCAITASFDVLYVFTSEMYPTSIRHSLLGACSMFGRIGSICAPQTPLLREYVDPVLVFGGMSILAGLCCIYFPETKNIKLPDTLEEAENIGVEENKEEKGEKLPSDKEDKTEKTKDKYTNEC